MEAKWQPKVTQLAFEASHSAWTGLAGWEFGRKETAFKVRRRFDLTYFYCGHLSVTCHLQTC